MAFSNKIISNSKTGQDIRFLLTGKDTNGEFLEMETSYESYSKEPAPHYHPNQDEDFTVIEGELTVRIDGRLRILRQGDSLHIAKNKVHSMWNNTKTKTIVNWKIKPALNTDKFLETATGLANDGKTDADGTPNILQGVLMANKYAGEFRLQRPPFSVQKVLFIVLTPFAYMCGYRPDYKKYLD
jgi:quercetin dioxygenase-like cupin family protein